MQRILITNICISIIFFAELILLWEYVPQLVGVNSALFPGSFEVGRALYDYVISSMAFVDSWHSVWRVLVGCTIGSSIGLLIGLLFRGPSSRGTVDALMKYLRNMPPVALSPLFIVWFGIDDSAKVATIAFACIFPVWTSVYTGLRSVSPQYARVATMLRLSKLQTLWRVQLPSLVPYIIPGVQSAVALSFIMIFVSELAGASVGIGYRISISQLGYQIPDMMAALIVLGLLGCAVSEFCSFACRRAFPWVGKTV